MTTSSGVSVEGGGGEFLASWRGAHQILRRGTGVGVPLRLGPGNVQHIFGPGCGGTRRSTGGRANVLGRAALAGWFPPGPAARTTTPRVPLR